MTGLDLARLFGDKIDEGYSDYVVGPRKQRMFDAALFRVVETIYMDMDTQKERDELSGLTVLDRELTINSNTFRTSPFAVQGVTFTGLIVTFTLDPVHNIQVGDTFTIADVAGVVGANTAYTTTAVTATTVTAVDPGLSGVYVANTGKALTTKMLEDYFHLLAIRCRMYARREGTKIDSITTGTTTRISTFRPNSLRMGDEIRLESITGVTGLPTTCYVIPKNMFAADLYSDVNMTIPIPTTGTYVSGGRLKRIYKSVGRYQTADEQMSDTSVPSERHPKVRQSRGYLNIYPTDFVCETVTVDYIKIPNIKIDVDDSSLDLYNYYSPRFLERVVDEAVKEFERFIKDIPAAQAAERDIMLNP
jgi:hypothetical protein